MALFRSVPVVETVFQIDRLPAGLAGHPRDAIALAWDERAKTKARWKTEGGVEFGTSLAAGTVLGEGSCLAIDRPPLVIVVHERPEPVLVATPSSADQAVHWAYCIGNSHQPLMIHAGMLVCLDRPGMADVLAYHDIPFTREMRPFTAVSAGPSHHG